MHLYFQELEDMYLSLLMQSVPLKWCENYALLVYV